jgi:hypothetical protein
MRLIKFLGALALTLLIISMTSINLLSIEGSGGKIFTSAQNVDPDLLNKSREIVYIILPVKILKDLYGVRFDSLIASSCDDNNTLIIPKLVPRRFFVTFMTSINTRALMPDVGDGSLNENDFLILTVPIKRSDGDKEYLSCPWNVYAAKNGLRDRYLIKLSQEAKIFTERGVEKAFSSFYIALYYRHDLGNTSLFKDLPTDIELLIKIGDLLDVERPSSSIVSSYYIVHTESNEVLWNKWLETIRMKLTELELEKGLTIFNEHREGFTYDPYNDQIVAEVMDKSSIDKILKETKAMNPNVTLIDDRDIKRFYEFITIISRNNIITGSISEDIYIGYNTYSSLIYIRANSTSSSNSHLGVNIKIVDLNNSQIVWSIDQTYILSSSPSDIHIYPSIPFDTTRRFNISITYYYAGGSYPYIIKSTLINRKIWDNMPINQTSKAYQILSLGIASLRDPYSGYPPVGCQRAKASDMLYPSVYERSQGIIMSSSISSLTVDSDVMNGLYYDSLYGSSPILYIDICVRNPSSTSYIGTISIKIDGTTIASKSVSMSTSSSFGYVGFTLLQWSNPLGGHGHFITIEHNFPSNSNIELYIDMLLEYQYAPEIWKETSYSTWFSKVGIWSKTILSQDVSLRSLYRSYIYVVSHARYEGLGWNSLILDYFVVPSDADKVFGAYISVRRGEPSIYSMDGVCSVRRAEGVKLESIVGGFVKLWDLIVFWANAVSLGMLSSASLNILASNTLSTLYDMSRENVKNLFYKDSFDCIWYPGLNKYRFVHLVYILFNEPGTYFYIEIGSNDLWIIRSIDMTLPRYTYDQAESSRSQFEYYNFIMRRYWGSKDDLWER